jgi:DNA-binding NtrC family response regulator
VLKRILWIDDDGDLIDDSIPVFEKHGFSIVKATNTSRALTVLREQVAGLHGVLLDVRLGGNENGLELLQDIAARYPQLRVAVFTGFPEYDDHLVAEKAGALMYLAKIDKSIPLDPDKQRRFFETLHELFPRAVNKAPDTTGVATPGSIRASIWSRGTFFVLLPTPL